MLVFEKVFEGGLSPYIFGNKVKPFERYQCFLSGALFAIFPKTYKHSLNCMCTYSLHVYLMQNRIRKTLGIH